MREYQKDLGTALNRGGYGAVVRGHLPIFRVICPGHSAQPCPRSSSSSSKLASEESLNWTLKFYAKDQSILLRLYFTARSRVYSGSVYRSGHLAASRRVTNLNLSWYRRERFISADRNIREYRIDLVLFCALGLPFHARILRTGKRVITLSGYRVARVNRVEENNK